MKTLAAVLALVALAVIAAPAEARGVAKSRQVVRGHGHVAQAQVICAAPAQVIAAPQVQTQFLYPAPQQVFLPQVATVYAPAPQVVAAPQVVCPPAQVVHPQVVLPQSAYPAQTLIQPQLAAGGRQKSKSKQVVRGNAAAQAIILPY